MQIFFLIISTNRQTNIILYIVIYYQYTDYRCLKKL